MKFDLHVHTTISECGKLDISQILETAGKRGLDGVCITDHGSMEIRNSLKEGVQGNGLCVIFGMEYWTGFGDFLIFGPFENIPKGLDDTKLLNLVNRMGGAAIAAHPFRSKRLVRERIFKNGSCRIIESINGRNSDFENLAVKKLCARYPLTCCGGSDAHTIEELGKVPTRFQVPIKNRTDLIHALNTNQCFPCHV